MIKDSRTDKDNRICLILTGVLVLTALISLFFILRKRDDAGRTVTVISEGHEIYSAFLDEIREEEIIRVVTKDGKHVNEVHISRDGAWVSDSDCKGLDCVNMGKVSHSGETIACLPNRLIVTIRSVNAENEESTIDAVTY